MHSAHLDSNGSPRKRTLSRGISEDESLRSIINEVSTEITASLVDAKANCGFSLNVVNWTQIERKVTGVKLLRVKTGETAKISGIDTVTFC